MFHNSPKREGSDVVDSLDRCTRIGDNVLTILLIEMSEPHTITSPLGHALDQFLPEYLNQLLVKPIQIFPHPHTLLKSKH